MVLHCSSSPASSRPHLGSSCEGNLPACGWRACWSQHGVMINALGCLLGWFLKSGQARARAGRAGEATGLAWQGAFLCFHPSPFQKGGSLVGFQSSFAAPAPHQPNGQQSYLFVCVILSSEWLSPGQSLYIEASFGCIFGGFYCSDAGFIPARLSPRRQHCRTSWMAAHAAEDLMVLLLWSTRSDDWVGQGVVWQDD